jgi:hypothetical protein
MEAVSQLAGGVAHDFNNLLTAILGYSELLLEEMGDGDPVRRDIDGIRKAAESAASLTGQLLAFSRKQILEPHPPRPDRGGRPHGHSAAARHPASRAARRAAVGWPPCRQPDPGQIEQIIVNLAVNARDAMPGRRQAHDQDPNIGLDETYVADHPGASAGSRHARRQRHRHRQRTHHQGTDLRPFFTTNRVRGTAWPGDGLRDCETERRVDLGVREPAHGTTFKVYCAGRRRFATTVVPSLPAAIEGFETILLARIPGTVDRVRSVGAARLHRPCRRQWGGGAGHPGGIPAAHSPPPHRRHHADDERPGPGQTAPVDRQPSASSTCPATPTTPLSATACSNPASRSSRSLQAGGPAAEDSRRARRAAAPIRAAGWPVLGCVIDSFDRCETSIMMPVQVSHLGDDLAAER